MRYVVHMLQSLRAAKHAKWFRIISSNKINPPLRETTATWFVARNNNEYPWHRLCRRVHVTLKSLCVLLQRINTSFIRYGNIFLRNIDVFELEARPIPRDRDNVRETRPGRTGDASNSPRTNIRTGIQSSSVPKLFGWTRRQLLSFRKR